MAIGMRQLKKGLTLRHSEEEEPLCLPSVCPSISVWSKSMARKLIPSLSSPATMARHSMVVNESENSGEDTIVESVESVVTDMWEGSVSK
jgi:hypothetical protein